MTPLKRSLIAATISVTIFVICMSSVDRSGRDAQNIGESSVMSVLLSSSQQKQQLADAPAGGASPSAGSGAAPAPPAPIAPQPLPPGGRDFPQDNNNNNNDNEFPGTDVEMRRQAEMAAAADNAVDGDVVHHDSKWSTSTSRLGVAAVCVLLAIVLPLLIYAILRYLEVRREEEMAASIEPLSPAEGEIRLVDQRYALARDLREYITVPLGCVAFIQFFGMAINIIGLPQWYDDLDVRSAAASLTAALLILAALWTWFRVVDVTKMAVGRQQWVVRSKMFSLYHEAATKVGLLAKFIGALVVSLVVAIAWGDTSDVSTESIIASLSVAALGSLAFVGNMFKGTLSRYKSGLDLIVDNLFETGDEIEIFNRAWGRVRGRVAYIESRFCIIIGADGKKMYVPTEFIPTSCLVNHSRSHIPLSVEVHLAYTTPPEKIQDLQAALREALVAHPALVPDSLDVSLRAFTPTSVALAISLQVAPKMNHSAVQEDVLLVAIQISQRLGVELSKPSASPDLGLSSFSTL